MSGPVLADRLLGRHPSLRVLYMSGYAEEAIERQGSLPAGGDLLEKPFTADQLARRCARPSPARRPDGRRYLPAPCCPRSPRPRPGPSTSRVTPPGGGASSSAAPSPPSSVAGYQELIPPSFEYEDVFLRAGGPGVATRLVRFPDRDGRDSRPALRLHFQPRPGRLDHLRRRRAAAPAELRRERSSARTRSAADGPARRCRSAPSCWARRAWMRTWRSCGSRWPSCGRPGSPTISSTWVTPACSHPASPPSTTRAGQRLGAGSTGRIGRPSPRVWVREAGDARSLVTLPFVIGRREALEAALPEAPRGAAPGAHPPARAGPRAHRRRAETRGLRPG